MKEQIKKDMVTAMKEKNVVARDILRVLKGEIERNEQTSKGKVELTNPDIIKLIKKLIESINESGVDNGEVEVLESYLPKQMSNMEISILATQFAMNNDITNSKEMGKIMGYFKQNYDGLYDGKALSVIVKELLS